MVAFSGEIRDDKKFMSMMEDWAFLDVKVVEEPKSLPFLVVKILVRSLIFSISKRNFMFTERS